MKTKKEEFNDHQIHIMGRTTVEWKGMKRAAQRSWVISVQNQEMKYRVSTRRQEYREAAKWYRASSSSQHHTTTLLLQISSRFVVVVDHRNLNEGEDA